MNIHLNVLAGLPKVTQGRFIDATVRAKTNCVVSRLLRANISMRVPVGSATSLVGLPNRATQSLPAAWDSSARPDCEGRVRVPCRLGTVLCMACLESPGRRQSQSPTLRAGGEHGEKTKSQVPTPSNFFASSVTSALSVVKNFAENEELFL